VNEGTVVGFICFLESLSSCQNLYLYILAEEHSGKNAMLVGSETEMVF